MKFESDKLTEEGLRRIERLIKAWPTLTQKERDREGLQLMITLQKAGDFDRLSELLEPLAYNDALE